MSLTKESIVIYDSLIWGLTDTYHLAFYDGTWGIGADSTEIWPTEVSNERVLTLPPSIAWDATTLRNEVILQAPTNLATSINFNRIGVLKNGKATRIWTGTFASNTITLDNPHSFSSGERIFYNGAFSAIETVNGPDLSFNLSIFPPSGTGAIFDASGQLLATVFTINNQVIYAGSELMLEVKIYHL